MNFQGIPACRRAWCWSCQLISWDILPGTGNLQRDPVSFHLELAWAPEGASGFWPRGKPGCAGEGAEGNEGKTMDRWGGGWASASCGFWPSWPRASQVINATQLLLAGHRSPLPLTLCTSKRSSAAVHTRRSAPGCAGLPGGAPSCTSFQPQSAPGAHHCSSGTEEIRDAGKQEHGSGSWCSRGKGNSETWLCQFFPVWPWLPLWQ